LAGACTFHELADWAEAVDVREDIELEPRYADVMQRVIVSITLPMRLAASTG
jgi:hypothetical protein